MRRRSAEATSRIPKRKPRKKKPKKSDNEESKEESKSKKPVYKKAKNGRAYKIENGKTRFVSKEEAERNGVKF